MKKHISAYLEEIHYLSHGDVFILKPCKASLAETLEPNDFIIPESVQLQLCGESLKPTHFDPHGSPQIGGIAGSILRWHLRQKVRDGQLSTIYDGVVSCSYETTDGTTRIIPFEKRVPRVDICPVCGERITTQDLDSANEIIPDRPPSTHRVHRVERLHEYSGALLHRDCAKHFRRLEMIDEITETVHAAFSSFLYDVENRFSWGEGERSMSYELIPNQYYSQSYCAHLPWFIFHTPAGSIKIGWRAEDISITFLPDFAPFDMAIFASEYAVAKGTDTDGARYIYAEDDDKLYDYLVRAHKAVLPNK